MKRIKLVCVTALLVACCAPPEDKTCRKHRCNGVALAFNPSTGLLAATELGAARWGAATGCDVRIEAGGVRVELWPHLYAFEGPSGYEARVTNESGEGLPLCGGMFGDAIYVADSGPGCPDIATTVAHEMGHSFGPAHTHAATGLMRERIGTGESPPIDLSTLDWACELTACAVFRPELD